MPCLALGVGLDERAVGVEMASSKNSGGLLGPDPQARLIDGVHQVHDVGLAEAAAEVPGGGGVGDALGAQGIEIDLVVASEFDVFDAFAAGEDVERDVQDVVGFVVGEMPLEDMEHRVDVADQSGLAGQQVHGADATGTEALDAIGQFVVDVGRGHHRLVAFGPGAVLDAIEDSPLALVENSAVAFLRLPAATMSFFRPLRFGDLLGIVAVTRKPPLLGIVRMCSYLYYSKISGGFRAFCPIFTRVTIYHAWLRTRDDVKHKRDSQMRDRFNCAFSVLTIMIVIALLAVGFA